MFQGNETECCLSNDDPFDCLLFISNGQTAQNLHEVIAKIPPCINKTNSLYASSLSKKLDKSNALT